ncbi:hypothetical protein EVG20_g3519 [Dentipellis fragilis]|uniref:ASTRA-associated protein 1 n=1 Tax=Dentipellis fragilis TaxID=205917 RepID=A0A4Y9Z3T0_9AGAM|nr:hypothetical protein EVG20_g3519 [Dentipellis fragilis]
MQAPAPTPIHLIRAHSSAISAVAFSDDNERIYTGDATGLVVVTSTRSLRALASWAAHTDGILGVQEWDDGIITHARDNKIHVWKRPAQASASLGGSAAVPGLPTPELRYSMDVNALNYCRFSLLVLEGPGTSERQALIAVPNLVESSLADIWTLPARERLHAAIGKGALDTPASDGRSARNPTGIIMSMHLMSPSPSTDGENSHRALRLLTSYENGSVRMWQYQNVQKERSIEGIGWACLWTAKLHVESVMAMAVSNDERLALSVSADHLIGRYDLQALESNPASAETSCTIHRTKYPGNSAIALRPDGRVCAIGDWDGKTRLYSTKSLKSLGTLVYHKNGVQALAFANRSLQSQATNPKPVSSTVRPDDDSDSDDEDGMTAAEKESRTRWLVSGGKDGRVAIWELMDFGRKE